MANNNNNSFEKHFSQEVLLEYQQAGTKLRSTVRTKNEIFGSTTHFKPISNSKACTKMKNGLTPIMNLSNPVECSLQDYYAGDWVDQLDELKTNIDERAVIASVGAYALGRKTDELIIDALSGSKLSIDCDDSGMTIKKINKALEMLEGYPTEDRFAIVGVHQWNELLNIKAFDEGNKNKLNIINGAEARKWKGIIWLLHHGLNLNGRERECFIYHKNAIGHSIGNNIQTDISWQGERAAHFLSNCMSQGACLIDGDGVVKIMCDDSSEIKEIK